MTHNVIAMHPSRLSKRAKERRKANRARYLKQFYRTEELMRVRLRTDGLLLMRNFPRLSAIEVGDSSVYFTLADYPALQVNITVNHV